MVTKGAADSDNGDVLRVLSSTGITVPSFNPEEKEALGRGQRKRVQTRLREAIAAELRRVDSLVAQSPSKEADALIQMLLARGPDDAITDSTPTELREAHLRRFKSDLAAGCNGRYDSPPYRFGNPLTEVVGQGVPTGQQTLTTSSSLALLANGAVSVGVAIGKNDAVAYPAKSSPASLGIWNDAFATVGTQFSARPAAASTLQVSIDVNVGDVGQPFFVTQGDAWFALTGTVYLSITSYDEQYGIVAQSTVEKSFLGHHSYQGEVFSSKHLRSFAVSAASFLPAGFSTTLVDISVGVGTARIAPSADEVGVGVVDLRSPSNATTAVSTLLDAAGPIRFPNISAVICPHGVASTN